MSTKNRIIHTDPEIMSGVPVFVGTRVPVDTLIDYLEESRGLDEFLEDFPSVGRDKAVAALRIARDALLATANTSNNPD